MLLIKHISTQFYRTCWGFCEANIYSHYPVINTWKVTSIYRIYTFFPNNFSSVRIFSSGIAERTRLRADYGSYGSKLSISKFPFFEPVKIFPVCCVQHWFTLTGHINPLLSALLPLLTMRSSCHSLLPFDSCLFPPLWASPDLSFQCIFCSECVPSSYLWTAAPNSVFCVIFCRALLPACLVRSLLRSTTYAFVFVLMSDMKWLSSWTVQHHHFVWHPVPQGAPATPSGTPL